MATIFNRTVPVSSPAAAEMTKLLENIYRCVNIALVNELKQLCHRMGIDILEVIEAAKTKPFGFQAFYPGPGSGRALHSRSIRFTCPGRPSSSISAPASSNWLAKSIPPCLITWWKRSPHALNEQGKPLKGAKVLVLGVAYKKDIDDLRESPSLTIIELLQKRGALVRYNDPLLPHGGPGAPLQPEYDMHSAREIWTV